jgi:hypothetical protein
MYPIHLGNAASSVAGKRLTGRASIQARRRAADRARARDHHSIGSAIT